MMGDDAAVVRETLEATPCSYMGRCNSSRCLKHSALAALDALVKERDEARKWRERLKVELEDALHTFRCVEETGQYRAIEAQNERLRRDLADAQELARSVMLDAYQAGAAWMREKAARTAEGGSFLHNESLAARFGRECAAAIRSLSTKREGM